MVHNNRQTTSAHDARGQKYKKKCEPLTKTSLRTLTRSGICPLSSPNQGSVLASYLVEPPPDARQRGPLDDPEPGSPGNPSDGCNNGCVRGVGFSSRTVGASGREGAAEGPIRWIQQRLEGRASREEVISSQDWHGPEIRPSVSFRGRRKGGPPKGQGSTSYGADVEAVLQQ